MSWKTVKTRIMNHNCNSQTWQSEQKSLLYVIEKAKVLGLDSQNAESATISNLRTIAPKAYQAAYGNQIVELDRLLEMAATYNCADLRIALGKPRESIPMRRNGSQVTIVVDEYQAGVIANTMRERYRFEVEDAIPVAISQNGRQAVVR